MKRASLLLIVALAAAAAGCRATLDAERWLEAGGRLDEEWMGGS